MKKNNFFYENQKKELISINITPLIDIVFLLLVFFMLATSFIQRSTMEINVSSGKSDTLESKDSLTILLQKNGDTFFKSKRIEINSITNLIKRELKTNPDYKILIKCHKKAKVQNVIRLIEEVRLAGTEKIKLLKLN